MLRLMIVLFFSAILPQHGAVSSYASSSDGPNYRSSGQLKMPEDYREWVFLTSGIDMNYDPAATAAGHSVFGNVFVNPSSYRAFRSTGTWPDKTTLVLEFRPAEDPVSINKRGHSQSQQITGMEVHVKDARLDGGWGFFEFDGKGPAKMVKRPASCYQCHESHAAVDTTFVQFYPTLLGLATAKGTLSPAYLKEIALPAPAK